MIYKRFYFVIIIYLVCVILLALAFAFSYGKDLTYTIMSLIGLVLVTLSFGVWLNRTNKKLAFLFQCCQE